MSESTEAEAVGVETPVAEKPCPCGGPMWRGVAMHRLDCPVLHGKPLPTEDSDGR